MVLVIFFNSNKIASGFFLIQAEWLMKNNFGGAMVWALPLDDFSGNFCGQGKYPLMNTLKSTLGISFPSEWFTLCTI